MSVDGEKRVKREEMNKQGEEREIQRKNCGKIREREKEIESRERYMERRKNK